MNPMVEQMPCPKCGDGVITIISASDYHPEVQAFEPPYIVSIDSDCDCFDDEGLCDLDFSQAEEIDFD